MALTRCENCGHEVPASRFCIRCGHRLEGGSAQRSRAYAPAPNERVLSPRVVSTIFPQLPHSSMREFRACLALGSGAVLLIGLAGLYPIALIAGALMLPVLVIIYMFDVNVFEDTSLPVVLGTVVWGLVTGTLTALLAKALSPVGSQVFTGHHDDIVLVRGLLIPLLSVVLILAGPAGLLRFPRFSTVLDGATFGAASAATFVGAEVIVQAISSLGHGLRPPGSVLPWLVQLAIFTAALPLVTIAAMAAPAGALWLKYRAPIGDRAALGRLGMPWLALPLGTATVILAALVQATLAPGLALALIAALAVLALLWLRQVIHVGLLEEALLIEAAPQITCVNCGQQTRRGRFCEFCGIALAALPASRTPVRRKPGPERQEQQ
jgi:ribosomal protein L32